MAAFVSKSTAGEVDNKFLQFVVGANLSFNQALHPLAIEFYKALNKNFEPPTRRSLASPLLQQLREKCDIELAAAIEAAEMVSIIVDGWTNIRGDKLLHIMIRTPEPYVYQSIDTAHSPQTSEYIKLILEQIISGIKLKLVSIISDSAANQQKAINDILLKMPDLISVRCIAHRLNNLMKSLGQIQRVKDVIHLTKMVVQDFNRSGKARKALTEALRTENSRISPILSSYVETRWYSIYTMSHSVLRRKGALKQLAWSENPVVASLEPLSQLEYWSDLELINAVFKPFAEAIKRLEATSSHLGDVVPQLTILQHNTDEIFSSPKRRPFFLSELGTETALGLKQLREPIFLAAYMLDPRYHEEHFTKTGDEFDDEYENESFVAECYLRSYAKKLVPLLKLAELEKQLRTFRSRSGIFRRLSELEYSTNDPVSYWSKVGDHSVLKKCALRLLFTTPSNADVERSFSMKKMVHSVSRNKLTNERAADLTFCHHHLNLAVRKQSKAASAHPKSSKESQGCIIQEVGSESSEESVVDSPESIVAIPSENTSTLGTVQDGNLTTTPREDFFSDEYA
ncbi:Zinc finger BED domain-containing protein 4 [Halotydeus destructor]|nr:Zinc finger BED domain-containing protein 4 [Halotydeus destructor]